MKKENLKEKCIDQTICKNITCLKEESELLQSLNAQIKEINLTLSKVTQHTSHLVVSHISKNTPMNEYLKNIHMVSGDMLKLQESTEVQLNLLQDMVRTLSDYSKRP